MFSLLETLLPLDEEVGPKFHVIITRVNNFVFMDNKPLISLGPTTSLPLFIIQY